MSAYYCRECNRYIATERCSVHGAQDAVALTLELPSQPSTVFVGNHTNAIIPGLRPPTPERQAGNRPRTAAQPIVARAGGSVRPVRMDAPRAKPAGRGEGEILRFRKSERMLHWAIAIPFVVCWVTALILVVVYNPNPMRPLREIFSTIHRLSGVCLIMFPAIVMLRNRTDYKIHLYNVKCGWLWSLNDLKWLALMGLAAVSKRIVLPEQGKFNAAEKVNFMSVMVACPLFILTGIMIWMQTVAWAAWLAHGVLALMVSPTMLGHIYMATINPDTRRGISGMLSGYVDRKWARHHYGQWYKEHFEKQLQGGANTFEMIHPPDHHVHIHCPSCEENLMVSWGWLLQKIFSAKSLFCPNCGASFTAIATITKQEELDWIKRQFEARRSSSAA